MDLCVCLVRILLGNLLGCPIGSHFSPSLVSFSFRQVPSFLSSDTSFVLFHVSLFGWNPYSSYREVVIPSTDYNPGPVNDYIL